MGFRDFITRRTNGPNARSHDESACELQELREQQAATAEILHIISRSPGDLQAVLDTVVRSAARLCDSYDAAVVLREGDSLVFAAHYGPIPLDWKKMSIGRGWPAGRSVADRAPVHIHDLSNAREEFPEGQELAQRMGFRTIFATPLMRGDQAIGALAIRRKEVRPFTPQQISLVTTFADQAVIAIENARLLNELRESLQQQTATSDVLGVISSSPGELEPVFEAMLANATRICAAKYGNLFLREGEGFRAVAVHGPPTDYVDWYRSHPLIRLADHPGTPLARVTESKQVLQILDLREDQAYLDKSPRIVAMVESAGTRTIIGVPMLKDQELIGIIFIYRQEVRPFADKQIAMLMNFASQAVIAIENTRLLHELRESLQQQTATADVLKVISRSAFDLQRVLDTLVKSATRLCNGDHAWVFRREGEFYRFAASYGLATEEHDRLNEYVKTHNLIAERGSVVGRTAIEGRVVHVPDVLADPEYTQIGAQEIAGYRAVLGAPLLRDGNVVGVIIISRSLPQPFTAKQIELANTFADQAVIAIENTRLLSELRESLQQQTATADVLKVISRSTFNIQVVLDTLVVSAGRLCGAENVQIYLRDGEVYRLTAHNGFSPEYQEYARQNPIRPGRGTLVARTALTGAPVHIPDALADPEYTWYEGQRLAGFRAMLGIPLLREGSCIGVMGMTRPTPQPFTVRQIELITTFADQAVIAIENARLFDEVQARTQELSEALEQQMATSEVLRVISSSPGELDPVFRAILSNAMEICEAQFGHLLLCEDEQFRAAALHNAPPAYAKLWEQPVVPGPRTGLGRLARTREVVHLVDLASESAYAERDPLRVATVELAGARTFLAVPMLKEGKLVGAIVIYRTEVRAFSEKQIGLLTSFANQAVIAIENTRLLS